MEKKNSLDSIELIEVLQSHGEHVILEKGMVIVRPGQPMNEFYFLESGTIHFYRVHGNGKKHLLYTQNDSGFCVMSMLCVALNKDAFLQAEVIEAGKGWVIPKEIGLEVIRKRTEFLLAAMDAAMGCWINSLQTLDEIAFESLETKLKAYLGHQCEISGNGIVKKSHKEISIDLNASREGISRELKKMEHARLVRLKHGSIEVLY